MVLPEMSGLGEVHHSRGQLHALPNKNDFQEVVVYITMIFVVMSWLLREIHSAFFALSESSEIASVSTQSRRERTRPSHAQQRPPAEHTDMPETPPSPATASIHTVFPTPA